MLKIIKQIARQHHVKDSKTNRTPTRWSRYLPRTFSQLFRIQFYEIHVYHSHDQAFEVTWNLELASSRAHASCRYLKRGKDSKPNITPTPWSLQIFFKFLRVNSWDLHVLLITWSKHLNSLKSRIVFFSCACVSKLYLTW